MKTTVDILKEYKALLDEGTITEDEFNRLKSELITKGNFQYKEKNDNVATTAKTNATSNQPKPVNQASKSARSYEATEKAVQIGCLLIVIIAVVLFFKGCAWLLSDNDDPGASLDYGPNYYYDSGTHQVERSLRGILNGAPEP